TSSGPRTGRAPRSDRPSRDATTPSLPSPAAHRMIAVLIPQARVGFAVTVILRAPGVFLSGLRAPQRRVAGCATPASRQCQQSGHVALRKAAQLHEITCVGITVF